MRSHNYIGDTTNCLNLLKKILKNLTFQDYKIYNYLLYFDILSLMSS